MRTNEKYFKKRKIELNKRDEEIRVEFRRQKRRAMFALAKEYELTVERIRQIINN